MNVVVPSMVHNEHKCPVEIAPETSGDILELIAACYMGEPTKVQVPRRPIRSGDELTMITKTDVLMAQQIQLQELREADKLIPKEVPTSAPGPTMQQVLRQAPHRAESREIPIRWEMNEPSLQDFAKQGDRIPVILQVIDPISEPSRRKVYLRGNRDETWESDAERTFRYLIEIHPDVTVPTANQVVPCRVKYPADREVPTAMKGVPLSFAIATTAVFNEEAPRLRFRTTHPEFRLRK
jgi:hypothetical protein